MIELLELKAFLTQFQLVLLLRFMSILVKYLLGVPMISGLGTSNLDKDEICEKNKCAAPERCTRSLRSLGKNPQYKCQKIFHVPHA